MKLHKYYLFVLVSILAFSCKEAPKKIETKEVTFTKEGELSLYKGTTDSLLQKIDIEIAETNYETETGLMYRTSMENKQGMLFIFEEESQRAFYMKNTAFPLDIVYIKSDSTIASFAENAQPFNEASLPSNAVIHYVLELNAGLAEKWALEVGDKVKFSRN